MNILQAKKYYLLIKAKFTYSPLGKAFEKQAKTIEIQGQKQIDAVKTLNPKELEAIKVNKSGDNVKLLKCKEIFNELSNERISKILSISKQTDFNYLNLLS